MARHGLLIDTTLCVGCEMCAEACKEQNNLPGDPGTHLNADNYTVVDEYKHGYYMRHLCMHCDEPTCVSVCPVSAIHKHPEGNVTYDPHVCMGCRYCVQACPFNIPKYSWNSLLPVIQKCNLCYERTSKGQQTACAEACPTGATVFGEVEDLRDLARKRFTERPDEYVHELMGDDEVGGTSVMYISDVPFDQLGFPKDLPHRPLPELTWAALSKVPDVFLLGGTFLFGVNWVIRRRMEVAQMEAEEEEE